MFLFMIFGAYEATYPQGVDPYTHRLVAINRLPSYSFEIINDDLGISRKVLGVKANDMKITFVLGEEIKVTMSFIGMVGDPELTPQTAVEGVQVPYMYDQVTIFSTNASEKVDVTTELTWTYSRNLEAKHSLGSKNPRLVKEGPRTHVIEAEMYQDDNELWDLVHTFTEFVTVIKAVKTVAADEFVITFPKCKTHQPEQDLPGDDILMEKATIKPYNQFGTNLLTMEIIDAIPDYDI